MKYKDKLKLIKMELWMNVYIETIRITGIEDSVKAKEAAKLAVIRFEDSFGLE